MKACRGTGASLPPEIVSDFEREHAVMLEKLTPESFEVLHHVSMIVLKNIK